MEREHFFNLLRKWPKIRFTDVCLIDSVTSTDHSQRELYVRDRRDPPSWLFINRINATENDNRTLTRYLLWLEEFRYLSLRHSHTLHTEAVMPPENTQAYPAALPAARTQKASDPA